jgi:hypothetical protein
MFSWVALGAALVFCSTSCGAQSVNLGWVYWDSSNQVLFSDFGHGLVSRMFPHDSSQNIDIFRDFAGLQSVYVKSVTAGPDGTAFIAATLAIRDQEAKAVILTYGHSGELLNGWEPAPQDPEVIRYTNDDDAVFVPGDSDLPDTEAAMDYPLLVEYSRGGRVLKKLVPASKIRDDGDSLSPGIANGPPTLRVTKDKICFYVPKNREVVMCDRSGQVLASRSIADIIETVSTADGYRLVQTHGVDFTDDGDIVIELLLENEASHSYMIDVVRVNAKTGEAVMVHRALNDARLGFIGIKEDQYLYIEGSQHLYIQSHAAQEAVPLSEEVVVAAGQTVK